jgi:hypothetical protein
LSKAELPTTDLQDEPNEIFDLAKPTDEMHIPTRDESRAAGSCAPDGRTPLTWTCGCSCSRRS